VLIFIARPFAGKISFFLDTSRYWECSQTIKPGFVVSDRHLISAEALVRGVDLAGLGMASLDREV
jgi:hypothetical protein